jgi:hypothetical protein
VAYCIASISENFSANFKSYCVKVFLTFFGFFLDAALVTVVLHRIVWYGVEANRGISVLVQAIDDVDSLLKGAMSDRGWAIGGCAKFGRRCARRQKFNPSEACSGEPSQSTSLAFLGHLHLPLYTCIAATINVRTLEFLLHLPLFSL